MPLASIHEDRDALTVEEESGLPLMSPAHTRQPRKPARASRARTTPSVDLLPFERTAAMILERVALSTMSTGSAPLQGTVM